MENKKYPPRKRKKGKKKTKRKRTNSYKESITKLKETTSPSKQ